MPGPAFPGEGWHHCHCIPGCHCPPGPLAASQPRADPGPCPHLHGLAALSCSTPVPTGVPCDVPVMSPLLLTCSPLCRSPLPPGPSRIPQDASRREHMLPSCTAPLQQPWVLLGAVSPLSPLCPLHPCCVPSVPAFSQEVEACRGAPVLPPCSQHPSHRPGGVGTPSTELLLPWTRSVRRGIERAKLQRIQPKMPLPSPSCPLCRKEAAETSQGIGQPLPDCGDAGGTNGALRGGCAPPAPPSPGQTPAWLGTSSPVTGMKPLSSLATGGVGVPAPMPAPKDTRRGI